jgi:hypothetical protein
MDQFAQNMFGEPPAASDIARPQPGARQPDVAAAPKDDGAPDASPAAPTPEQVRAQQERQAATRLTERGVDPEIVAAARRDGAVDYLSRRDATDIGRPAHPLGTRQPLPDGWGIASGAPGQGGFRRSTLVAPETYTARDGTPTRNWEDTQAYADAQQRNLRDAMRLAQIEQTRGVEGPRVLHIGQRDPMQDEINDALSVKPPKGMRANGPTIRQMKLVNDIRARYGQEALGREQLAANTGLGYAQVDTQRQANALTHARGLRQDQRSMENDEVTNRVRLSAENRALREEDRAARQARTKTLDDAVRKAVEPDAYVRDPKTGENKLDPLLVAQGTELVYSVFGNAEKPLTAEGVRANSEEIRGAIRLLGRLRKFQGDLYGLGGLHAKGSTGEVPTSAAEREARFGDIMNATRETLRSLMGGEGRVVHINGVVVGQGDLIRNKDGTVDAAAQAFLERLKKAQ